MAGIVANSNKAVELERFPYTGSVESGGHRATESKALQDDSTDTVPRSAVLAAVQEIIQSPPFRKSKQCQSLLRYIVKHSLSGQEELLRERVIGSELFGRAPDYDASNDPIVRARVAEVRKRLAQYYTSPEFKRAAIRIEIPMGSYRALIERATEDRSAGKAEIQIGTGACDGLSDSTDASLESGRKEGQITSRRKTYTERWKGLSLLAAISSIAILTWLGVRAHHSNAIRRFWGPALQSSSPILIYTGTNVAYQFSPAFLAKYRETHGLSEPESELIVDLKSLPNIDPNDLEAHSKSYVTIGDVSAFSFITSELTRLNKPYQLRYADDISAGDVRSAPVILIGAFNNAWTLKITAPLRFTFIDGTTIQDNSIRNQSWSIRFRAGGGISDDYAVVSRVLSPSGELVVSAAGINEYGTEAASQFISDPSTLADIEKSLPRGWEKRNLQIVLHVKVVDGSINRVEIASVSS